MNRIVRCLQRLQFGEQRRLDFANLLIAHAFQAEFVAVIVRVVVVVTLVRVIVVMTLVHVIVIVTLVRVIVVVTIVMVVVARVTGNSNDGGFPIVKPNVQFAQLTLKACKLNGQGGIPSAHARLNLLFNAHQ